MVREQNAGCLPQIRTWLCWSCLAVTVLLFGCAGQPMDSSQRESLKSTQVEPDPQQALVHAQEGTTAYERGDISAVIDAWQLAVELNPNDAVTHNNLALLLKQKHRFKEATAVLEAGLEHSPEVAELHYNLAVISELYLLDLSRALAHYQRYQALTANENKKVTGWIADLERRLD